MKEFYQIHCHKGLGTDTVAMRRIPCHCDACRKVLRKPWIHSVSPKDQPRFQDVPGCELKPILGNFNSWEFVQFHPRKKGEPNYEEYMDEEAKLVLEDTLDYVTSVVASEVEIRMVGAVVIDDPNIDGYYLVQWTETPFTCQETNKLK